MFLSDNFLPLAADILSKDNQRRRPMNQEQRRFTKTFPLGPIEIVGSSDYAEKITLPSFDHLINVINTSNRYLNNSLCIDIGANIGLTTILMDQTILGSEIICFEPHPKTYSQLTENIEKNKTGRNRISPINIAIGRQEETLSFRDVDKYNTGNSFLRDGSLAARAQASILVDVKPLDSIPEVNDRDISLLKLDVEGFEIDVLLGAKETLKRTQIVLMEFNHWCLSSIARILPDDALSYVLNEFKYVFVYDLKEKRYRKLDTDVQRWSFLHQNMVTFNVNDLMCTNNEDIATNYI